MAEYYNGGDCIVHAAEKRLLEMKKQVELGANKPQEKLK